MNKATYLAAPLVLAITALISSCASAPTVPAAPRYQAPWASLGKPEFREFLASYGAANLPTNRNETIDRYLRSQTKTFDRYVAAKEVGVGVAPLQQEALVEIQSISAGLPTKQFMMATTFSVQAYDARQGGFPIYQQPFDLNAGTKFFNDDVRSSRSQDGPTRGMRIAANDYGFTVAEVWFSKVGWVLPATPDQAISLIESLSRRSSAERKVSVAMTYTIDRCDSSNSDANGLVCDGTIRSMSAYSALDAVQPDNPPVVEMVNRNQN